MDEMIEYYKMHKFVLSVLFDQNLLQKIVRIETSNEEDTFFNTLSLDYVNDIFTGKEKDYLLVPYRQLLVKEYILNYVGKYKNDQDKSSILSHCRNILYNDNKTNYRKMHQFYKKAWKVRTNQDLDELNEKIVHIIDKSVSSDYKYLEILYSENISITSLCMDTMCFMSMSAFIEECPILFYNPRFLSNVKELIEASKKCLKPSSINENMIIKIEKFITKMEMEKQQIERICKEQYIFSLIFAPCFDNALQIILQLIGQKSFFTDQNFKLFKNVVLDGLKNCVFDSNKKENIRQLLHYFNQQSTSEINEIKRELNRLEDAEWKEKNDAFYMHSFELHHSKKLNKKQKEILLDSNAKRAIDEAIYHDIKAFNIIFDENGDITQLYGSVYTTWSINYLINTYPELFENSIYASKIVNILELQKLVYTNERICYDIYAENKRTLKKIKKLKN